jgi:alpha-L-rhamnosidase
MTKPILLVYLFFALVYQSLQVQPVSAQSINQLNVSPQLSFNQIFKDLDKAYWISDDRLLPVADSLFYLDQSAPIFRKEFSTLTGRIKKATLFITAAGYYAATINGEKIGFSSLEPAWTDFRKRIYYAEIDLTKQIKSGNNCLGVELGNGFYNPLPLRMFGIINLRERLPVGKPSFIARLIINYENGTSQEIFTDQSWKYSYGPVLRNNVYLGIKYDASKEIPGWNKKGFSDLEWRNAIMNTGPGGKLEKAYFPPIKSRDQITPVSITSPQKDFYIIDMGENFAGAYKIRLKGAYGDSIVMRFGERVYENGELDPMTTVCGQIKGKGTGGPGAPNIAWQTDSYRFGKNNDVWFTPDFTFHTFRYIEITGLKYRPTLNDIKGLSMNTAVEQHNHFECSSPLLNKIQKMSTQTFLSNLFSVQSDCPAREKFGYGGDLNAVGESFIYNFDMQSFYRKTVSDWVDAMKDSIFIDTAPYIGLSYCGISWESAFLITQYNLLIYYNDVALVREMYQRDLKWMEKVKHIHPDGIVDKGLSDHEALAASPVQLIGTLHYLKCAQIMIRFAHIMNDTQNEKRFNLLVDELKIKLLNKFWNQPVDPAINKQTLFASLLFYGVIPEKDTKAAQDSLKVSIEKGIAGHLMTGIFGTKYALESASANGLGYQVFNLVNSTQFPGWGFMVDKGATTLWETWKESDNVYSNCHPMFGVVSEWFYRWLGGIRPDPDYPGFRRFVISPVIPSDLDFVKCSYKSPFGMIKSNWYSKKNSVSFELTIPRSSTALFELPSIKNAMTIIEKLRGNKVVMKKIVRNELIKEELSGGDYRINVTKRACSQKHKH